MKLLEPNESPEPSPSPEQTLENRLERLKEQLRFQAPVKKTLEIGSLPGSDFKIHAGQMIEVIGEGSYAWIIQFLKAIPKARVAWVSEQAIELFPMAVAQEKISLSRFLFLEKVDSREGISKLLVLLQSGLFQAVVFEQAFIKAIKPQKSAKNSGSHSSRTDAQLRKLQLTAEDFGSALIMLSQRFTHSFGVHIQVQAEGEEAQFIKVKGRTYGK